MALRAIVARAPYFNPSRVTFLHDVNGNLGGKITPQHISGSTAAIDEIPTAIPMFSGVPDSKVLHTTSPEVVFSCKSKMAAAKPEIVLCQRRYALETKFQVLYPCFRGCPT